MYDIEKCQKIEIEQGYIYLGPSNKNRSVGYLELKPKSSLTLHNRPTGIEKLTQIKGRCDMVVYDGENGKITTLKEGNKLVITPQGTWHLHINPYDNISLTYWDFEGDITNIIGNMRRSHPNPTGSDGADNKYA